VDRKTRTREKSSDPPKAGLVSAKAEPQHPPLAEDQNNLSAPHQLSQNQEPNSKEGWVSHNGTIGVGCEETNTQYAVRTTLDEPLTSIRHKRLSMVQKILVSCIVLIAAMLLYALLSSIPDTGYSILDTRQESNIENRVSSIEHQASSQKLVVSEAEPSEAAFPPTEGLSLKTAETFYLQKDFNKAYAAYDQLRSACDQEDPLRDFLALKMAFCMKNLVPSRARPEPGRGVEGTGDFDQAAQIFRMVSQSHYPVVRTVANYHLCLLEMQKEQYLNARRRAYQTMALISALTFDWQWTLSMQQNCHFLIAESVTRHVLSLRDADKDCPAELWPPPSEADPLINLSEAELRRLLSEGCEQLRGALLSPQIQQLQSEKLASGLPQSGVPRWEVYCNGATIEELLARFAAHADLDIHWACDSMSSLEAEKDTNLRKRPVTLYMSAATTQQFVTAAAGCVGLLARLAPGPVPGAKPCPQVAGLNTGGTVKIQNPSEYASLSEHLALLAQEAVSLWQRFLLTFGDDKRICNAHFALGLLQGAEDSGQITDAIAEYKLVANRYPRTSLAPLALLASSKLKANLRDYLGAREDLKLLTEQYPDTEFSGQACLHLADATMKAGLLSEAARLYCKVYNLGFSLQSQKVSALGAGRCFYQEKDYENAAKWLTRYINLSSPPSAGRGSLAPPQRDTDRDFYLACLLLGKTYLAQDLPQQACDAFELALTGQLPVQEYIETVSALVKTHIQLGHFVEALKLLENTNSWQLSQKESIEMILLEASVLRSMGLVDEAIAVLGDKAEYVLDPQLKAKISFEQAKCSITKGNLQLARKNLSEILVLLEPSATDGLAHEVRCELADVCLKLGSDSQAISICLQLLDSDPKAPIKQKASDLLATAYTRQKNYDQAALALLGQWPRQSDK